MLTEPNPFRRRPGTDAPRWPGRPRPFSRLIGPLGAALLLWLGLWLHALWDDATLERTIRLPATAFTLSEGAGFHSPSGLSLHPERPEGVALAVAELPSPPAARYPRLVLDLTGVTPAHQVSLVWTTHRAPRHGVRLDLDAGYRGTIALDLGDDRRWQGRIEQIGIAIGGPADTPGPWLREVRLEADRPTPVRVLTRLACTWLETDAWSGRSINAHPGGFDIGHPNPTLLVALWVLLAWLLAAARARFGTVRELALPLALFVLVGWLALDLRWQWDLATRLQDTRDRYAGLAAAARQSVAPDGPLLAPLRQVRDRLPGEPTRLWLITADPDGYLAGRVRYHLAPHNTFIAPHGLPPGEWVRPGDHLLVLPPVARTGYNPASGRLIGPDTQISAEVLLNRPGFGMLFRAREPSE